MDAARRVGEVGAKSALDDIYRRVCEDTWTWPDRPSSTD